MVAADRENVMYDRVTIGWCTICVQQHTDMSWVQVWPLEIYINWNSIFSHVVNVKVASKSKKCGDPKTWQNTINSKKHIVCNNKATHDFIQSCMHWTGLQCLIVTFWGDEGAMGLEKLWPLKWEMAVKEPLN